MNRCQGCGDRHQGWTCPSCGTVRPRRRGPSLTLAELTIILVVALLVGVPTYVRARAQGRLTSCKSNLKNIATACELYSCDNTGLYPPSLDRLSPYLGAVPSCPSARRDTYSESYRVATRPDFFTLYCSGLNHQQADTPVNFPQYYIHSCFIER